MNQQPTTSLSLRSRLLTAGLAAIFALAIGQFGSAASAQQPATQKKEKDKPESDQSEIPPLQNPTDEQWLQMGDGFDRIVLVPAAAKDLGRDEIDVIPLEERPLKIRPTQIGEKLSEKVRIVLFGQDTEVDILRTHIKEVKHFEDLLLIEGKKHVDKFEMDRAFEFYNFVANQQPNWRGLDEKLVDFWFHEAERRMIDVSRENEERALHLLHEMRQYCASKGIPEHKETAEKMGRAMERLVDRALESRDFARGRHVMHILELDFPDHPILKVLRTRYVQGSESQPGAAVLQKRAKEKEEQGQLRDASFLIMQAADMWPTLPGVDEDFQRIFGKYPVLHVAVRDLPPRFAPWAPAGSPDARVAQLLHVPLIAVAGVGENTTYDSRLLASDPELAELGRRVTLRVKPGLKWSDGEKPITAMDISRSISARIDPNLPSFDPALASVLKEQRTASINELVVDLKRTQLRPQMNFLFNLAPGHRLLGDRFDENTVVGAGPFRHLRRKNNDIASQARFGEVSFEANQHFFAGKPKISEIVERRYLNGKDAVKALLAGDVALLEHVLPKEIRRIEARGDEFAIVQGAVPGVHVISFDFRARLNRTLRRAMVYAIDRRRIFVDGIWDGTVRAGNDLIDGPFPRGSFAFEPTLEPWPYDPVLAKGLADASKKEAGVQSIRLTMHHPDTEEVRETCRLIKVYWNAIGIDLELVAMPQQELEEKVALGRRFDLVYRIGYVRDPVLDAARLLCLGQPISAEGAMPNAASAWLRQNLRELEFATSWDVAINKIKLIQHQARDDVAMIPLWQLNDYAAYQKRLRGVVDHSLGIYQDAENWQIEPWYRKDNFKP